MTFDEWWTTTGSDAFMAFPVSPATAKIAARKVWDASRRVVPTLSSEPDMYVEISKDDGNPMKYAPPGFGYDRVPGTYACFRLSDEVVERTAFNRAAKVVTEMLEIQGEPE